MAGYITYWPKEQIRNLERENDKGPITVIFGSIHTKMPSIKSVKVGDIIYPVTLVNNSLYVVAKMPVEQIETAAQSEHGSTIKLRPIPLDKIKEIAFWFYKK
ncbi:MAG: hypothetical protein HDT39_07565 [Lachnospiraceae bacterium]|nr:hypothetical protein [Lachnospiraceae bacterium]